MNPASDLGSIDWTLRTGGRLGAGERRRLIADLVGVHARNAAGRLGMLVHLNSGRRAQVSPERLMPPDSALTRAAEAAAVQRLPATLLNHSYRTYTFGMALGELEDLDVDAELLFAAAMLHDTGLTVTSGADDFTLASARLASEVAEGVGLSTRASQTLQTAITMHHSPRVTLAAGAVPYLLSAGAGVDVVGLRSWELPRLTVAAAVREHPRDAFKTYFARAWMAEAARVPQGRAQLLRRYGGFTAAIRLAPFNE
jgi:hypothetical protein